jgi:hypothetical protein
MEKQRGVRGAEADETSGLTEVELGEHQSRRRHRQSREVPRAKGRGEVSKRRVARQRAKPNRMPPRMT